MAVPLHIFPDHAVTQAPGRDAYCLEGHLFKDSLQNGSPGDDDIQAFGIEAGHCKPFFPRAGTKLLYSLAEAAVRQKGCRGLAC